MEILKKQNVGSCQISLAVKAWSAKMPRLTSVTCPGLVVVQIHVFSWNQSRLNEGVKSESAWA